MSQMKKQFRSQLTFYMQRCSRTAGSHNNASRSTDSLETMRTTPQPRHSSAWPPQTAHKRHRPSEMEMADRWLHYLKEFVCQTCVCGGWMAARHRNKTQCTRRQRCSSRAQRRSPARIQARRAACHVLSKFLRAENAQLPFEAALAETSLLAQSLGTVAPEEVLRGVPPFVIWHSANTATHDDPRIAGSVVPRHFLTSDSGHGHM